MSLLQKVSRPKIALQSNMDLSHFKQDIEKGL